MSRRSDMASDAPVSGVRAARAFRDAGVTALLAFGLFLPLVGFETVTNVRNDLILVTRWPLLIAVVAIVGIGRLAYSLVVFVYDVIAVEYRPRLVPAHLHAVVLIIARPA